MKHQPNCAVCGQFVGRKVRVEKFDPLVVTCDLCVYKEELATRQESQAREQWLKLVPNATVFPTRMESL